MAPIENAAGYRHGPNYGQFEYYLQQIVELDEKGEIKNVPPGDASLEVHPNDMETKDFPFSFNGGLIIPFLHSIYDSPEDHPSTYLGPYTTYTIEREDFVLGNLGCRVVELTGHNKELLKIAIGEKMAKIFLGKTKFSLGNRPLDMKGQNFRLTEEATIAIAALSLTPESLLPLALEEGILIGDKLPKSVAIFARAALLPAKRLEIKGKLSEEEYLLPISLRYPITSFPASHMENLKKLKPFFEPSNPHNLKPVIICWHLLGWSLSLKS